MIKKVIGGASILILPLGAAGQAVFEVIPHAVPGQDSYVTHVSGDGRVAAGGTAGHVFRWSASAGMQVHPIPYTGFHPSIAGISTDGSVVGWSWNVAEDHDTYRWSDQVTYLAAARPMSMSDDGERIAGYWFNPVRSGAVFIDGVAVSLLFQGTLPMNHQLLLISGDGRIAYGIAYGYPPEAGGPFSWDPQTGTRTFFTGSSPGMNATNHDGSVLVGHSARWTHFGTAGPYPLHPTLQLLATAISGDGQRIVGWYRSSNQQPYQPFIWDAAMGVRDLRQYLIERGAVVPAQLSFQVSFWRYRLLDVSDDGTVIVGSGQPEPGGPYQGWRATVPAPCYANCDSNTTAPLLNILDLVCFVQRFVAGDTYANCDNSSAAPLLSVPDFSCFLQKFVAGCGG